MFNQIFFIILELTKILNTKLEESFQERFFKVSSFDSILKLFHKILG